MLPKGTIQKLLNEFFERVQSEGVEIYNEFSLQHELGIFLRKKLPNYRVQFERNVSYFFGKVQTIKKEIDIAVFNEDKSERYAVELKAPRTGQYPERMYQLIADIKFMEEVKKLGFNQTYSVILVEEKPYYLGRERNGIYRFFREEKKIYGEINKPTGNIVHSIIIEGSYPIQWLDLDEVRKYCVIEI